MHCGDQRHIGLCLGYVPALAYGSCRVSDQGTTLRASDLHNARATILNPFNKLLVNPPTGYFTVHMNRMEKQYIANSALYYIMICNHNFCLYSNTLQGLYSIAEIKCIFSDRFPATQGLGRRTYSRHVTNDNVLAPWDWFCCCYAVCLAVWLHYLQRLTIQGK